MRDANECQAYVDYLLAEHRRLHRLVAQTRNSIVHQYGPDRDVTPADVAHVLQNLRAELVRHFNEEEAGGCMEEAVSRCPHLSAEVKRIEAEHAVLLACVDRVIYLATRSAGTNENRMALPREFEELCRTLHAHQNAEDQVLKQAFGVDFDGSEIPRPTLILDT